MEDEKAIHLPRLPGNGSAFKNSSSSEDADVQSFIGHSVTEREYSATKNTRCVRLQIYTGVCLIALIFCVGIVVATLKFAGGFSATLTQLDLGNANYTSLVTYYKPIAEKMYAAMNKSADPCQDAYNWGCGQWLEDTVLSGEQPRVSKAFTASEEEILGILETIVNEQWPVISPFFHSCNETFENGNFSLIMPMYSLIASSSSSNVLFKNLATIRSLYGLDLARFAFTFETGIDVFDPTIRIMTLWQGASTLPSVEYYDPINSPIDLQTYIRYITSMFSFSPNPISSEQAATIVDFEKAVANAMLSSDEFSFTTAIYNKVEWSSMGNYISREFTTYVTNLTIVPQSQKTYVNIGTPTYFRDIQDLIQTTPLSTLKNMALYSLYKNTYSLLGSRYYEANHQLYSLLTGTSYHNSARSREIMCLYTMSNQLDLLTGHYFVQSAAIDYEYKKHILELISEIRDAFDERLRLNAWMDSTTRIAAEGKLEAMRIQACYPEDWNDVLDFEQRLGLPLSSNRYFNNSLRIQALYDQRSFDLLAKPVDPMTWSHDESTVLRENPDIVNAFYSPNFNRITIPSGITRTPFLYSYTWKKAPLGTIYGGLGTVIGHEFTHGFDNQGSQYGPDGKLVNWWTDISKQQFNIDAQCIATSRSHLETQVDGLYVNGFLTLGENIADLGGVETALDAMLAKKNKLSASELVDYDAAMRTCFPDMTETKLFFLSYIQLWCSKETDESVIELVDSNPHPPGAQRIKGTLRDVPRFAQEFSCKVNSPYNPSDRCEIW